MGALLALASAVLYGVVDFAGGLLSRRVHYTVVSLVGQLGGLAFALVAAVVVAAEAVGWGDLAWGALSGVGSGIGMLFLNRGLSRGAMSVVVPVSAVTGVALSVLCGVLVLGDRPSPLAWIGIGITVPALWLVSGGGRVRGDGAAVDGLLASLGIAVQYLGLAQADPASGLWPVAAGRLAAVLILLPGAHRHRPAFRRPASRLVYAALIGAGAALGLACYLEATRQELLAIAVVLASLYPAIPTILGLTLLHERLTRTLTLGLLTSTAAIAFLTLG
ncbi:EamA family transporter [Streptomyces sp. B6B3]|uniref:EamA family transporter n=1 Tax=Streptomyces sp. B6B3 TaxID=3153570 RepID=UPI00325CFC9C